MNLSFEYLEMIRMGDTITKLSIPLFNAHSILRHQLLYFSYWDHVISDLLQKRHNYTKNIDLVY